MTRSKKNGTAVAPKGHRYAGRPKTDLDAEPAQPAEPQAAPESESAPDLVQGTPDERSDAQRRAQAASEEIAAVLERHRCRMVPQIVPQLTPVGYEGTQAMVTASVAIMPLP